MGAKFSNTIMFNKYIMHIILYVSISFLVLLLFKLYIKRKFVQCVLCATMSCKKLYSLTELRE